MLYLFRVCLLFAIPILGMAGFVVMMMAVWIKAKDYVRAAAMMRRIRANSSAHAEI